jgi:hypothetical protein
MEQLNMSKSHNVIKVSGKEVSTDDLEIGQSKSVNLDLPRESESLIETGENLNQGYLESLAFMEEPITIVLQKSSEKHAANVVDCWVNGRGAEIFDQNGKWHVCGWLPVGKPVITRRKYVEVLARAKRDSISTEVVKHENREDNMAHRTTSMRYPFSVLKDDNPKGYMWLTNILSGV